MKFKKIFFLFFAVYFISLLPITSDEIKENGIKYSQILILKNGNEYKGRVISIDNDNVIFETGGVEKRWPKTEIDRVQFHKARLYEDKENINEINDEEIKSLWDSSKKWQPSYENQIVILLDKLTYDFDENQRVTIRIKKAIKILNEEGKEYSTQYFYYLKGLSNAELLYGITILPDGSIRNVDESAINDEPINNKIPHYNKLHRIKFGLKDVDIGSVIVWEAKIEREWDYLRNPVFIEKQLVSYENIEKQVIKVTSPESIKINYGIYNGLLEYKKPEIKEYKDKNYNTIYLEENNVSAFTNDERGTPSDSMIYPAFYASPNIGWEELTKLYYDKYINKPISKSIEKLANEITNNEKNQLNKLKIIYEYINRKINYTNVAMQSFQFVPIDEEKVLDLSSLNILDKSYLFYRMSEAIGIPIQLYLYRDNNRSPLMFKCPSLHQFDSTICAAKIGFKSIYFSFESPNFAPDQSYYSTSNAYAIELTKEKGGISKLRETPYKNNTTEYTYECELHEDDSLKVDRLTKIEGVDQVFWRNKRFLSKEELDKYMENRTSSLGNNVILEGYNFENKLDEFEKPVILNEKLEVINYSFPSGENIKLLKIPEIRFGAGSVGKSERLLPYSIGETMQNIYKIEMVLPKEYRVKYMPKALNLSYDGFSIKSSYKAKDNMIKINITTIYTKDEIPTGQYKEFKNWSELKAKLTDEWIIVEREK